VLIKAPPTWPHPVVAAAAMILLAGLDLGGALAAKEAVLRRSWPIAALGVGLFLALFWVYCSSLQYADLAPVTLGWVVVLQIGVVLLDRFRYGTAIPAGRWIAVAVILAAEAYLIVMPALGTGPGREAAAPAAPPGPPLRSAAPGPSRHAR
jgi:hypothetical protein